MYDPWQRWRLRKEVFPYKYKYLYDDKSVSYLLCKAFGHALPDWYGRVDTNNFKEKISSIIQKHNVSSLIVKPIIGNGGNGVLMVTVSNNSTIVREGDKLVHLDQYILREPCLVQECIQQHKNLNNISKSINTIRIVTMLTKKGEVIILGARMRFGVNDAFLDNTCQGGIAVKINMSDGTLAEYAYDNKSRRYAKHPTSGYIFRGFQVPYWHEVEDLSTNVQKTMQYNRIIGQDIAITSSGPVIIELNSEYDNVMFEQACGPILQNKKVLYEFNQYDLLVNKYQKNLLTPDKIESI
jgi:hypothetical protein